MNINIKRVLGRPNFFIVQFLNRPCPFLQFLFVQGYCLESYGIFSKFKQYRSMEDIHHFIRFNVTNATFNSLGADVTNK